MRGVQVRAINSVVENQESERASSYTGGGRNFLRQSCLAKTKTRHSLYSHGKNRHFGDSDCPASDAGRGEDMGAGVGADRGTGSAARAREPCAAPLLRRASALALNGMAAFTRYWNDYAQACWLARSARLNALTDHAAVTRIRALRRVR
jgi:hypothetical protein